MSLRASKSALASSSVQLLTTGGVVVLQPDKYRDQDVCVEEMHICTDEKIFDKCRLLMMHSKQCNIIFIFNFW